MSRHARLSILAAGVATACSIIAIGASAVPARSTGRRDSGVFYATVLNTTRGLEYAAGYAQDKVLGQVAIVYVVKAGQSGAGAHKITTKSFTLYARNGSLSGSASATQTVTSTSISVTNGKFSLTHGRGGQAGHTVIGTFSGPYDTNAGEYILPYKAIYR
jgi:hypothetical protein